MAENKVIDDSLKETLQKVVGFRNVLVHLYEKIDPVIVYTTYQKRLGDFDAFIHAILQYLATV